MSASLEIATERLTLRRWRPDDADAFAAMHADAEVTAWLARGPMTVADARADIDRFDVHFDAHGFGLLAVERKVDRVLIGLCGLHQENRDGHPLAPCVEIAWRQARAAWGRGYMSEAASAALADGFQRIGLTDIFAWTADANHRSQRLMQRIGMQRQPMLDFDHPALADGHPLRRHVVYVARPHATSR
ncbi:GNAT family N-acetyltransferase [Burkholderia ubonensis subsp. mesacidophila]|uniref:GNAT family N-acetyltransferase n=2 Tax=Burkholderia ubonensis TaxID=101571 RepID=A0A2A4FK95_9BURK|nr:GNAT family N-acetyltransferase [Burkholderia ubonensis]PCE32836.1 GNAT family N-acetyltransferase [Burkholderia ubonensis subsp. mesacidophila]